MVKNSLELEDRITQELKKRVITTLKYTVSFCETHNLRYFMACGSALGTARHQGMIPWDDDTDIYMLREDYVKLHEYYKEISDSGYELVDLKLGTNYYCPSAKIVDRSTTLWEMEEYPYVVGAFVDIFPLDYAPIGMQGIVRKWTKLRSLFNTYMLSVNTFNCRMIKDCIRRFDYIHLVKGIVMQAVHQKKRDKYLSEMLSFEKTIQREDGFLLVSYTETGQYVFPKEWFEDFVMMPFEDFEVRMAIGYKEYLAYFYGDYMQMPPEEKRKSTHSHYYLNLKEGLTIEETRKRIQKGETLVF